VRDSKTDTSLSLTWYGVEEIVSPVFLFRSIEFNDGLYL